MTDRLSDDEALWLVARVRELETALRPFVHAGPRYLSIGSIDNVVEVRLSSEAFDKARALARGGAAARKEQT